MLLIVDDSFELSSQTVTYAEKVARAAVWSRVLFGIIPENRLQDAYDRAFKLHDSPFPVNAYEMKSAWEKIKTEEREAQIKESAALCPSLKYHVGDTAQTIEMNPHTQENELYPCPNCRTEDYENKKKTDIALYGEIKPIITFEQIASVGKSLESDCACGHPFHAGQQCRVKKASGKFCECWNYQKKKPQEEISTEEAAALAAEHNDLVSQIAKDAAKDLLIIWDEGANCFVRANYRARTYSAEVVRKAVEDYRRILGDK